MTDISIPAERGGSTIDVRLERPYIRPQQAANSGRSPAGGTGMNEFELGITIDRPIEAVRAYFQDFSKYPEGTLA